MSNRLYFTPGPSALYFTVEHHLRTALREDIPAISHRSSAFKKIYAEAVGGLHELLGLPDYYQVVFLSSANEIWERMLQNLVASKSGHLVNGAFSSKCHQFAQLLQLKAEKVEAEAGSCIPAEQVAFEPSIELIAVTHNETSTGAAQPITDMEVLREKYPKSLIAVDGVSSLPYVNLPWHTIDCAYFSVQKCFGLPAGLGVWLVNDRCIEKAEKMEQDNRITGTYHRLTQLVKKGQDHQTPETPNVLNIYLLAKVTHDMLEKGLDRIRQETHYKAAVLYQTLNEHPGLSPFVKEQQYRSKTVIVADCEEPSAHWIQLASERNMVVGSGYGDRKDRQIRIANFPTHSKEQVEALADLLMHYS